MPTSLFSSCMLYNKSVSNHLVAESTLSWTGFCYEHISTIYLMLLLALNL